jgi:hypothetical protein
MTLHSLVPVRLTFVLGISIQGAQIPLLPEGKMTHTHERKMTPLGGDNLKLHGEMIMLDMRSSVGWRTCELELSRRRWIEDSERT